MGECDKLLETRPGSAELSSAKINAAMSQVSFAAARHDRALESLAHALEISLPRVR
jgi:hypothetical protein